MSMTSAASGPTAIFSMYMTGPGSYIVPALADGDDGDGVAASEGGQRGAVDGVHGDVGLGRCAVADALAVEQHRRLVLLALADDHHAVHGHGLEDDAHGVDRGAVGGVLVAPPTQRAAARAAASVTRTSSMARFRVGTCFSDILEG
jgi:hypothetical protein